MSQPSWRCPHCQMVIPGGQYHDCKGGKELTSPSPISFLETPLEVKFTDDAKEKYQSHEAEIEGGHSSPIHSWSLSLIGYGATKEESCANLQLAIDELKHELDTARSS